MKPMSYTLRYRLKNLYKYCIIQLGMLWKEEWIYIDKCERNL